MAGKGQSRMLGVGRRKCAMRLNADVGDQRVVLRPLESNVEARKILHQSLITGHLELRLKEARSLLLQTDMSVINVALACGFSSPSHFSKCYRAFCGRTPYRERGIPVIGEVRAG